MIKTGKLTWVVYLLAGLITFQSCTDDRSLLTPPPPPDNSFVEEFDTIGAAYDRGWRYINKSVPAGLTNWMQGDASTYGITAFSTKSTYNGYIIADYFSTAGAPPSYKGTISNWVVSPSLYIKNGDKIIFYTVCQDPSFVDRLQVTVNPFGDDINVGSGTNAGNFSRVLLDINQVMLGLDFPPGNDFYLYPYLWTRFEITVSGLVGVAKRRFAFRYYLPTNGGPGTNSAPGFGGAVALDQVTFVSKK